MASASSSRLPVIGFMLAAMASSIVFFTFHRSQDLSVRWRADGDQIYCTQINSPFWKTVTIKRDKLSYAQVFPDPSDKSKDMAAVVVESFSLRLPGHTRARVPDLEAYVYQLDEFVQAVRAEEPNPTLVIWGKGVWSSTIAFVLSMLLWALFLKRAMGR